MKGCLKTTMKIVGWGFIAIVALAIVANMIGTNDEQPEVARVATVVIAATSNPSIEPVSTEIASLPEPAATEEPTATSKEIQTTERLSTTAPAIEAANTDTPLPTSTTAPIDTLITSASDSESGYASGGLGLSQFDWEQNHTETSLAYQPMGTGYDSKYDVMFQTGNVWLIERQWDSNEFAPVDVVETESRTLIPLDSQLIETYNPAGRPETVVNLYFSESLKSRFRNEDSFLGDWWTGGEPGNFIVLYNVYDGQVGRMIIGIGNNP